MVRRLPQQAGTGFLGEGPRPRTCGSIGHAALAYREGGRGLPLAVAIGCGECGLFLLAESGESFSKAITRTRRASISQVRRSLQPSRLQLELFAIRGLVPIGGDGG
jgi:hypothetical protein